MTDSFLSGAWFDYMCACMLCFSNESDVVSTIDDVYNVGTFVQISELHDIGDRMRLVIQGHRR